jgi:hypothetical protein
MRISDLALRLLGSTSGETIVRAASAASGAITLPAGTTDFSGTGGASQVVKQTSAGGPFTVAQLAASDVTGALTGNQTITLSGDVNGSGATAITATLPNVNANVGTFQGLTVNAKGLVTAAVNQSYAPLASPSFTGTVSSAGFIIANNPIISQGASATFAFNDRSTALQWSWLANGGSAILYNGSNVMNITVAGACSNVSGTWSAISDKRLKEDIAPYERGLEALLRIEPVSFRYNGLGGLLQDEVHYGLIADDVAEVMPEICGERMMALEEGSDEVAIKTVDPGRLIYALMNSIKELAARVAALEARHV